ncbi:hypothetical protein SAMN05421858_3198 [Haladaptatus litoreus]|uniref:Membrane domain of glycerophosphoryl diester phosphodiesterase n=1 Tax=Haladaptatus litoreus TaxID=553468 RepID=A0A1N7CRA4_9EURY|nr:hypothetical protein [Haladaptatus litoreus]SIR66139.1 hypothetical protein SAMN05421858_3198 [Haladaptatus litoreus]
MTAGLDASRLDPLATVAAFVRVTYTNLVTVAALSIVFTLVSIPVVTAGAAVVALIESVTVLVEEESDGGKVGERESVQRFLATFRENLLVGVPLSVLLAGSVGGTVLYTLLATIRTNLLFLFGIVVGGYVTVLAVLVVFRAATLVVRGTATDSFSSVSALRNATYHLFDAPWFSVLQAVFAAILIGICLVTQIGVVLVLPGMIAVLEVVSFEERSGEGAKRIVRGYRGEIR